MKRFYLLFLIIITALLSACGQDNGNSVLWEITGNGLREPSYLLGTHHLAPSEKLAADRNFNNAYNAVRQVVGELDMGDMQELAEITTFYSVLPEGQTYLDFLPQEQYDELDRLLTQKVGFGMSVFGTMHPAAVSQMYSILTYRKVEPAYMPGVDKSMDEYVQDKARRDGKPVKALETPEEQLRILFDTEPLESQVRDLICGLRNEDFLISSLVKLNELYAAADIDGLYELSFNNPEDPCPVSDKFKDAINRDRNNNWMRLLPGMMEEEPTLFVVGALHLAGEEGLISQLRQKGYTVQPVN